MSDDQSPNLLEQVTSSPIFQAQHNAALRIGKAEHNAQVISNLAGKILTGNLPHITITHYVEQILTLADDIRVPHVPNASHNQGN